MIPSARQCADVCASSATSSAYVALALSNIASALGTGVYSTTLTVSGKAGADVMFIRKFLRDLGYTITQSASTITISWAS